MYIIYKEDDEWEIAEIMYYIENEEIAQRYCEEMNNELCKKYKYQLYKYRYKRIDKLEYKEENK